MTPELDQTNSATTSSKALVLLLIGAPYTAFVLFCFALIAVLPSETGEYDYLIQPGMLVCGTAILLLCSILLLGAMRAIKTPNVVPAQIIGSIFRVGMIATPGIGLAIMTIITITSEPTLYITMVDPPPGQELIAPLSITFSAKKAAEILALKQISVLQYSWDFDGDRKADIPPSVNSEATYTYERPGIYTAVGVLQLSTGETRTVSYRFSVPQATLAIEPKEPIVDEPVGFNVSNLFTPEQKITTIKWSFGDSEEKETNQASAEHTFIQVGSYIVTAVVQLENGIQQTFERTITVKDPPPLPFDIAIKTVPDRLISPAPFSAIFTIETPEELDSIEWDFGEGQKREGLEARYTFLRQEDYTVTLNVRSKSGKRVRLTKLVRVVPELQINDLVFNGSNNISLNKLSIVGEQPVKINITPISESQPFVEYYWDARDATAVIPAENPHTLQAIYRYPGTYRIGLLAQDPGGKAKRIVIPVTVEARKADVGIRLSTAGGEAPLDVTFDSSETFIPNEEISGFEWKFGDQTNEIPQQGGAVTTHTYAEPGTFTVKMTVTTTVGNQYSAEKTLVVRPPRLNACFTPSRISGSAPMGVIFDSSCTTGLPSEYSWDFGDQTTSNVKKPTHLFEVPGVYKVELKLNDKFDSLSKTTIEITVYEAS